MLRELITINPRSVKSNPRKKRRSGKKHRVAFRRNPRFLPNMSDITKAAVPAVIGGAGALGLDVALGNLTMIPAEWKSGHRRTLLRAGLAFAIGFAARSFLPAKYKQMADQATAGALTVTAYDAVKGLVVQHFPDLTLGMYDGDLSAYERINYSALPTVQALQSKSGAGVGAYARGGDLHGLIPAAR